MSEFARNLPLVMLDGLVLAAAISLLLESGHGPPMSDVVNKIGHVAP